MLNNKNIITLFIFIVGIFSTIFYKKYKEYTSKIYVLEKNLHEISNHLKVTHLKQNEFYQIKNELNPLVQIHSHTYLYNGIIVKNKPNQPQNSINLDFAFKLSNAPQKILIGDFIWGDSNEEIEYFQKLKTSPSIKLIKGNHETLSDINKDISDFSSFIIDDFQFISFNLIQKKDNLEVPEEIIKKINEVEIDNSKKLIILTHHNIFSNSIPSNLKFTDQINRNTLSIRETILNLNPVLIIIGDGGVNVSDFKYSFNNTPIILTGWPYINSLGYPQWINLYKSFFTITAHANGNLYEKKFLY